MHNEIVEILTNTQTQNYHQLVLRIKIIWLFLWKQTRDLLFLKLLELIIRWCKWLKSI